MRHQQLSKSCIRRLTVMGWVMHTSASLGLVVSLTTDHWLHKTPGGEHTGILPCCPSFQCQPASKHMKREHVDAFVDMVIVGTFLVWLGLITSIIHACCTWKWKSNTRTFRPMVFFAAVCCVVGGIILLSGAVEFSVLLPSQMIKVLESDCKIMDAEVKTGFSFEVFVTGAVSFIIAGVLLCLGRPNRRKAATARRLNRASSAPGLAPISDVPLQTISGDVSTAEQILSNSNSSREPPVLLHRQLSGPPSYEDVMNAIGAHAHAPSNVPGQSSQAGQDATSTGQQVSSDATSEPPPAYDYWVLQKPPPYSR